MLKRLAAISLLLVMLFNLIGYRLIFDALQHRADKQLEAKLDRFEYNEKELITLRVPLSMPYLNSWSSYERVDGEIHYNGQIYHYVKRMVRNGEMILKCLPDQTKMQLETAKNDYFKNNSSAQPNESKKSSNANSFKQFISDYDDVFGSVHICPFNISAKPVLVAYSVKTMAGNIFLPERPPCA